MRALSALARLFVALSIASGLAGLGGCSGPSPEPAPPCDGACQDATALRGLRETLKLAYNLTVQGKPEGEVDATSPCLRGGSVRVHGHGDSDAVNGTTNVVLTYDFDRCAYLQKDTDPTATFSMSFTGSVVQQGALSAASGSTTALGMQSASITLSGTVYDPPIAYDAENCALAMAQNGNQIAGTLCGRPVGFGF
jgi:hypothetical protein